MTVCEAVRLRIARLLEERKITLYRLTKNSGVFHGTIMGIMQLRSKSVNVTVLIKVANGFGMDIHEFLNDPIFKATSLKL